jgi:predicted alpha/beta-hydrolase family hydrolase
VRIPMLFLQGTRDALGHLEQLQPLCAQLGPQATLRLLQEADHSFHVLVRSGRTNNDVRSEMLGTLDDWLAQVVVR